ncbi:TPA: hypothetical protein O7Y06_002854 [Salmonella enterica]|nr:hypothetical protein [Salmonella enterica]EDQ1733818.1 hypothetical protein [Salmonella enterica]EDT6461714.1 hypothetical protein [Salmonella enterica subsp. enterica]EHU4459867.1 hypothetical protein [Salmonella enterica]HDC2223015.1 hypothetical protein [Salmonella enterica]
MNVIPLSEFSGVHGSRHARLYIKTSDSGTRTVVSEKPGARILTRIGKLPLLRNRESVQERRNAAAAEDYHTMSAFQEALRQAYGDDFSRQAIHDITGKTLTRRVVKQVINNAGKTSGAAAEEPVYARVQPSGKLEFISSSGNEWNAAKHNVHRNPFSRLKKHECVTGSDGKKAETSGVLPSGINSRMAYEGCLKNLEQKTRDVKSINGQDLKNLKHFKVLATGDGHLRSLMTAAQGVAQFTDNPDITKAIQTLLNVHIGGIPFLQFGTYAMDGGAAQWVKTASQKELNDAADMMRKIAGDFEKLLQNIKSGQDKINAPSLGMARFSDIRVNPQTQVVLSDGTPLPVNTLTYGQEPVALAGSFPTENGMEKYLQMLAEKNCSCLAVLTPPGQMVAKGLPFYFAGNHKYGEVEVSGEKASGTGGADVYRLTIRYQGKVHTLHVIHALNWPDHGALPRTDDLRQLAQLVNQYQSDSPGASVPMIHCLGGVGRTGTLAAATLLLKAPDIDLDRVVNEFRDARNEKMLEDDVQRGQLKTLQQELQTPSPYVNLR